MNRITPPECTACGGVATHESDRLPEIKLCARCSALLSQWFIDNELAHGNPFYFEIAMPAGGADSFFEFKDGTVTMAVMTRSKYDSSCAGQEYIRLPKNYQESS